MFLSACVSVSVCVCTVLSTPSAGDEGAFIGTWLKEEKDPKECEKVAKSETEII